MESFFDKILEKQGLSKHDGRPLWKYNLSIDDYTSLKEHLSNKYYVDIDPRDITLLFAEWWKNEYNGGIPSKENVYNIINYNLPYDDFYKFAKNGAYLLGLKWIQRENTFYFRTMLLQGGLPIKHILNNTGAYTNFLKKVLEVNPNSIDEFAYDHEITKLLPSTSQNDAIYESCLQIVQAIWSGNDAFLSIFNSQRQDKKLKNISDELKKHKETIQIKEKRNSQFRAYWILVKKNETFEIKLQLNFPFIIENDELKTLIDIDCQFLKNEYQLIINDLLICKFKKNIVGNYKVIWYNQSIIIWDGKEKNPEVYLLSNDGIRFVFSIRGIDYPKISIPTLWTQRTENEWILNKGKYCQQEKAVIIFSKQWHLQTEFETNDIVLVGNMMNWCDFEREITLAYEDERIKFQTSKTAFEWFLQEQKPAWMLKANMPVVCKTPQIVISDKFGQKIDGTKTWRLTGNSNWNKWNNNLPIGCIEYKIEAIGCEEKEYFYNIGNLDCEYKSDSPESAEIEILNNLGLDFELKTAEILEIKHVGASYKIELLELNKMPKSIGATIKTPSQNKKLQIEILPPFNGIRILKSDGDILLDKSDLLFGHLAGYRIYTPLSNHNYFIKIYNSNRNDIAIRKKLPVGIIPLREYEEISKRLFRLTDAMDKNSSVTMEFLDVDDKILSTYTVKNYNRILKFNKENEKIELKIENIDYDKFVLFAIPLDCSPDNIELIAMQQASNYFVFPDEVFLDKFILISQNNFDNHSILLPCFVCTDLENNPTTIEDRKTRVLKNKNKLIEQFALDKEWKKVKKYFDICVQFDLPFTTFDHLRAINSPELAAKLFCLLVVEEFDYNAIDKSIKDFEEDLGLCFHWISQENWVAAIKWIICSHNLDKNDKAELITLLDTNINLLICNTEPIEWFSQISDYITNRNNLIVPNFHLKTEIASMRQTLGEKVLNELPKACPTISDEYKKILSIDKDNYFVKILLKAPLAIALSIKGKDHKIWGISEENEKICRNIQYTQWLCPDWYGKAILYCLNKLNNT